jgi:mRNA-degrading endonuclease YafQ of YafQ-DinJ toxin-antitoxin module
MYKIILTDEYKKIEKKFFKKHPELKERYKKVLKLLRVDPFYPSLRLHKLQGSDLYSISITMQYRIILDFIINDKEIILVKIGSHDEAYKGI